MNIVVEKQPKCIATLNVEVPAADVAAKREKIASSYASQAKISGFRPGKAPKNVIQKRFGKQITEELTEALFEEACDKALDIENLKVLDFGFPNNLNERPYQTDSSPRNHPSGIQGHRSQSTFHRDHRRGTRRAIPEPSRAPRRVRGRDRTRFASG